MRSLDESNLELVCDEIMNIHGLHFFTTEEYSQLSCEDSDKLNDYNLLIIYRRMLNYFILNQVNLEGFDILQEIMSVNKRLNSVATCNN